MRETFSTPEPVYEAEKSQDSPIAHRDGLVAVGTFGGTFFAQESVEEQRSKVKK